MSGRAVQWGAVLLLGLCAGLGATRFVTVGRVPSDSMSRSIRAGDILLIQKHSNDANLQRGAVAVFEAPGTRGPRPLLGGGPRGRFVKRVVGVPGDTVRLRGHELLVNGHAYDAGPGASVLWVLSCRSDGDLPDHDVGMGICGADAPLALHALGIPIVEKGVLAHEIVVGPLTAAQANRVAGRGGVLALRRLRDRSECATCGDAMFAGIRYAEDSYAETSHRRSEPPQKSDAEHLSRGGAVGPIGADGPAGKASEERTICVPKAGERVTLAGPCKPSYLRLIRRYERAEDERSAREREGLGNTEPAAHGETYVFRNDYYFVVGDNRVTSIDSRQYGPIPASMAVGAVTRVLASVDPTTRTVRRHRVLRRVD